MTAETDQQPGKYVTVSVADHLLALPITQVHDLFVPEKITSIPLAPEWVLGLLSIRGRIVAALDAATLLGFDRTQPARTPYALLCEVGEETYALLIDDVGDVVQLSEADRLPVPTDVHRRLSACCLGLHDQPRKPILVIDVYTLPVAQLTRAAA